MKITIFSEELRKCLNAAGLPDYTWNYWYQRLMNAYNESIERQIMTEQAENAKLRELVRDVYSLHWHGADCTECPWFDECNNHGGGCPWLGILADRMRELGVEVE